jgi:hypothetical protein
MEIKRQNAQSYNKLNPYPSPRPKPRHQVVKRPQSKPQSTATNADNAQLSSAAQSSLAAMRELTETAAQTIQEAHAGDLQAQQLLSKEAVAKAAGK